MCARDESAFPDVRGQRGTTEYVGHEAVISKWDFLNDQLVFDRNSDWRTLV